MLARWKIIDQQFTHAVQTGALPAPRAVLTMQAAGLDKATLLDLFDAQLLSRHLDIQARVLKESDHSYYTISSSGHEGNAVIGQVFRYTDMAFLHYRSGALMLQRAKQQPSVNIIEDILNSLMAAKADPVCSGRHKIFASLPLHVVPQTSTIASHLPKALGAAVSITRAAELSIASNMPSDAVVLCSFGDASVNHSTAQGAFNATHWLSCQHYPLPIVYICEDNGIGISTPTPPTWIEASMAGHAGIHYIAADGLHLCDTYRAARAAEQVARVKHKPVFLHLRVVRLMGHAGSDIETHYWTPAQIAANEAQDPLLHSARLLLAEGILSSDDILAQYERARVKVQAVAQRLVPAPVLKSADEVLSALIPSVDKPTPPVPSDAARKRVLGVHYKHLEQPRTMQQMINLALFDLLIQYDNLLVFGEDVSKKGGVYRVTADLVRAFGQRRVFDTLLDEQTILGTAIGLGLNGFLPMPEIQYLAYLHNAADQVRGEAATLSFFSNGQYSNPMVIRVPGLAYQKGFGGHFHNDNAIGFLREIPGIVIACPSNGVDAVRLLRQCVALAYQHGRVVVFLEPIACYMRKDLHNKGDGGWLGYYPPLTETIPLGQISVRGSEQAQGAIITYGNGVYLSEQAVKHLHDKHAMVVKIIDLHWLAPLPLSALLSAIKDVEFVVIVDECRKTGSLSEQIVTQFIEQRQVVIPMARVCAEDSFIPLGPSMQTVLPSVEAIVQTCLDVVKVKETTVWKIS